MPIATYDQYCEMLNKARQRRVSKGQLQKKISGDLEWICLKALEKDRTRRYGSAQALAVDIRRHQKNDSVSAGPPSARYRIGKFIQRHRMGVTAAGFVVITILLGIGATTWALIRTIEAEDLASQEASTAQSVSDFPADYIMYRIK